MEKQMKKLWMSFSICCLMLPISTIAKAEQTGLYAAPKFILGYTESKVKTTVTATLGKVSEKESREHKKSKALPGGALAIGYDFNTLFDVPLRTEIELSFFKKLDIKSTNTFTNQKTKIELGALLANAYCDLRNSSPFIPYIGAGAGASSIKTNAHLTNKALNIKLKNKTKRNFAWLVTAGVAYEISESFALDLGYRFVSLGKGETDTRKFAEPSASMTLHAKTKHLYMHQLMLGARLTF